MGNLYYNSPFNFGSFLEKEEHKKSTIKQSISNFLHVILSTYLGECDFDDNFGNAIWNLDFNNLESTNKLRVSVAESLEQTISTYEKRLKNVDVEIKIDQRDVYDDNSKQHNIKKHVDIFIKGTIKKTNESFAYNENFFIAPLSY